MTLATRVQIDGCRPNDFTDLGQPIIFEITLNDIDSDDWLLFPDEIEHLNDHDQLRVKFEATYDSFQSSVVYERTFPGFPGSRATPSKLKAIGWSFVSANRILTRDVAGNRSGALRTILDDVEVGDDTGLIDAITTYREALAVNSSLIDLRTGLASALTTTFPRQVNADDLYFLTESDVMEDPLQGVTLAFKGAQGLTTFEEQSDGMRALTALALYSMLSNESKIIGIDEPELHLHPPAQRGIGALLSKQVKQQVIATNSPNVLAKFEPTHVVAMSPTRTVRQLPHTAAAASSVFIAKWWTHAHIEPLSAAKILVIEGVTDRMILESVVATFKIELDRSGVALIELVGATNIGWVSELYGPNGFDIPIFGLVDEDHEVEWAAALGVSVADLETVGIQVCRPDLEGMIVASLGVERVIELLASGGIPETDIEAGCRCARAAILPETLVEWMGSKKVKVSVAVALSSSIVKSDSELFIPLCNLVTMVTS
jgi:putative ATP-dependent endonuclease of OLD family